MIENDLFEPSSEKSYKILGDAIAVGDRSKQMATHWGGYGLSFKLSRFVEIIETMQLKFANSNTFQKIKNHDESEFRVATGVNLVGEPVFYNLGFWQSLIKVNGKMEKVSYLSGHGGITVVFFQDNTVYFEFADDYDYSSWVAAAVSLREAG